MKWAVVVSVLAASGAAWAQAGDGQQFPKLETPHEIDCAYASAATLPPIPGLRIMGAKTNILTDSVKRAPAGHVISASMSLRLPVSAPGLPDATYFFTCGWRINERPLITTFGTQLVLPPKR